MAKNKPYQGYWVDPDGGKDPYKNRKKDTKGNAIPDMRTWKPPKTAKKFNTKKAEGYRKKYFGIT